MDCTQSLALLQQLHPKLRQLATKLYLQAVNETPGNVHPYIVQTLRSMSESDHDYQLGRTIVNPDGQSPEKPMGNIITKATAGHSWHNYGLALDFGLLINGKPSYRVDGYWMQVVRIFEAGGFNSGLYFPEDFIDAPHLESKMGQTIAGLITKYSDKHFIPGTQYVNF